MSTPMLPRDPVTTAAPSGFSVLRMLRDRCPLWVVDVVICLLSMIPSVWGVVQNWEGSRPGPLLLVLVIAGSLALLLRRRFPAIVALVGAGLQAFGIGIFGAPFGFYALGAYARSDRKVWSVTALSCVPSLVARVESWANLQTIIGTITFFSMYIVLPVVLGRYTASRRALLADWVERAKHAEREQQLIADRTRDEERTRIASEMHDSIAHQVSLVVLHAGALQLVVGKDPAKASTAAATIETVGRGALDELRETIGVLRGRPQEPGREPSKPTLDELDALIAASRDAGLPVELTIEGQSRSLPDVLERAAYRVVQEALTNVHKHAGAVPTSVHVSYGSGVHVSVRNQPPARDFRRSLPSGGQGLIGLRERVQLANGTLDYGPTPEGGFHMTASFPQHTTE